MVRMYVRIDAMKLEEVMYAIEHFRYDLTYSIVHGFDDGIMRSF